MVKIQSYKHQLTRNTGPSTNISQINAEGLTRDKCKYPSKPAIEKDVDVIPLQEAHLTKDNLARANIPGYNITANLSSPIHGLILYVKNNFTDYKVITKQDKEIEIIIDELKGLMIVSIYKPPNVRWPNPPTVKHPCIYIDLNSRHINWGNTNNDENGVILARWIYDQEKFLSYDGQELKTFRSARWQTDTCPVLYIVIQLPLSHTKKVLKHFPKSQHRPTVVKIGLTIPLVKSINKPR